MRLTPGTMLRIILICLSLAVVYGQNHPQCGTKGPSSGPSKISSFVVGGQDTEPLEFPWQISLQRKRAGTNDWYHTCGAALLNEQWALIAAHCVDSESNVNNYKVILGEHDTTKVEGTEIELTVTKIIIHENWDRNAIHNDVAVLKLSRKVDLSGSESHIGTVCLPDSENVDALADKNCVASGFGRTTWNGPLPTTLQKVTVRVWPQSQCILKYGSMIKSGMICFGERGAAVCSGDSGGPLNCFVNGKWYSYGAHSFTVDQCEGPNNVSVAARNSQYSAWIWAKIAAN